MCSSKSTRTMLCSKMSFLSYDNQHEWPLGDIVTVWSWHRGTGLSGWMRHLSELSDLSPLGLKEKTG